MQNKWYHFDPGGVRLVSEANLKRTLEEIENELDEIQAASVNEEDEVIQSKLERKFAYLLDEATEVDGVLRNAAGVTINNWTRSQD